MRRHLLPLLIAVGGSDSEAPTITLTSASSGTVYDTVLVTATASEDITGLDDVDIVLVNCLLSEWTVVSASVYTFVLTAIAGGTFSAQIPAESYQDLAGNLGAASNLFALTYGIQWFVDQVSGADGNDGLSNVTAKATIQAAITAANADATRKVIGVMGSGAIYRQTQWLDILTGITLRNYNDHTPILTRAELYTTWAKTGGYTNIYESAIGATVTVTEAVYQDTVTSLTSRADLATLDAAAEGFYADFAGDKLYINMSGADKDPAGNVIEAVNRTSGADSQTIQIYLENSAVVDGMVIRHSPRTAIKSNATVTAPTVQNCTIEYHLTAGYGVGVQPNGTTRLLNSVNNVFRKCKTSIANSNGATMTSSGDRITETAVGGTTILGGTTEVFTLNNFTVDNCLMTATDTLLIQAHWTLTGTLTSHDNAGIGVRVNCPVGGHSVSGWSVHDNGNMGIIHNSGGPLTLSNIDVYANGSNGINGAVAASALIVNGSRIYNNAGPGFAGAGAGSKALYCTAYNNVTTQINLTGANALIEGCKNYVNATATPTWNFTTSGASSMIRMCIAHGLSTVSARLLTGDNIRAEYNCMIQRAGGSYTLELEEITHAWAYANVLINEQGYYSLIMKKINALDGTGDHGGAEHNIAIFGQIYCKASIEIYFRSNYIYHRVTPSFYVAANGNPSVRIEFTNNVIDGGDVAVKVESGNQIDFAADNNDYINSPASWNWIGTDYFTLATWKAGSSVDANSGEDAPTDNVVLVTEALNADLNGIKWGWINIENWSGGATVTVDLSSLTTLTPGNTYKLQNALNEAESVTFVYNGADITITMANWSTDAIYEAYPRFGAFVVESV